MISILRKSRSSALAQDWTRRELDRYHRLDPDLHIGIPRGELMKCEELCSVALSSSDPELLTTLVCEVRSVLRHHLP
jgi:hypothetical protein